jgi:pimeloyl-ACP methyl ester carboxylesterase
MLHRNKFLTLLLLTALLISACQPIVAPPEPMATPLPEGGAIAQVNDIATYYEIHGVGEPLLFMPGDLRSTEDVAKLTDLLAKEYQVIVMDPRGRGRSTDSDQPLTMALMADDAVALLDKLDIAKAHVVGWASSAAVGLEMAMRYPERVDKLVLHGPNYTVEGLAPDHLAWFKSLSVADMVPMFEEQYNHTAPDPAHLPVMLARFQELILREPNYTVEMLSQIQAPTLVIDGDLDDWIVREHLETLATTIPNGELVLLPELTHFAPFEDPVAWTDAVLTFLNKLVTDR